ncbi:MAG: hypothetical protein JWP58_1609 [Hymenobacter sp.]|nr:hypothetical protein [Hymenobacter sp.]
MAVSEAALRENYRRLSDEKLMRIASEDAIKLRSEALALLKEELAARGLAETAEKTIAAQFSVVSEEGVAEYCALLQTQPCPICRSSSQRLNATMTSKVISFLVMTTWKKQFAIACPPCLDKLNRDASTTSALLGWWGFPWGIIRTVQALVANGKMARNNHAPYPNDLLKAFVVGNIGRIEAIRANATDLQALIKATHLC